MCSAQCRTDLQQGNPAQTSQSLEVFCKWPTNAENRNNGTFTSIWSLVSCQSAMHKSKQVKCAPEPKRHLNNPSQNPHTPKVPRRGSLAARTDKFERDLANFGSNFGLQPWPNSRPTWRNLTLSRTVGPI